MKEKYPLESKIIWGDKDIELIQRESSYRGEIKGFNLILDENIQESVMSFVHGKGNSIFHWQGTLFYRNTKKRL
jgi:hypothetical protein